MSVDPARALTGEDPDQEVFVDEVSRLVKVSRLVGIWVNEVGKTICS